jgi:hypothetical protein
MRRGNGSTWPAGTIVCKTAQPAWYPKTGRKIGRGHTVCQITLPGRNAVAHCRGTSPPRRNDRVQRPDPLCRDQTDACRHRRYRAYAGARGSGTNMKGKGDLAPVKVSLLG